MGSILRLKTLLECCDLITDGSHKSPKTYDKGFPYVTVKDVNDDGIIDTINCKKIIKNDFDLLVSGNCQPLKGDILFSKDGTVGKVALVDKQEPFVVLSSLAILRPNKKILESSYFRYMMLSPNIQNEAIGLKTGAAIKRVVLRTIKSIKIPLPPLPEQERIVGKLDGLFEKIDQAISLLEENIAHTEALMGSVLDEEFGKLERNYESKPLAEIVKVINGRAYKKPEMLDSGKYPILRVGNFFSNRGWYYSDMELNEDKYCEKGDLLYAWSASFGPKIWDGDKSIYHYHIWKLVPLHNQVSREYFYYLLESDTEKIKEEGGRGVGMIHITKGGIEKRMMVLPPLKVQNKVVKIIEDFYDLHDKLLKIQTQKLNHLKALKSSLLDQAFKGEM